MWRASKLSGVAIYGPDNRKVGNISDVLMDHSGKAAAIVIGVGGFLGIGQKDVAVPYDQVHFTDQPMPRPAGLLPAPGGLTPTTNEAETPKTTALGMPADTTGNPNAPMVTSAAPGTNSISGGATGAPSILGSPVATTTGDAVPGTIGMAAVPTKPGDRANGSTSYPDHGTIDLTADQLKAAPSFQFAK